MLWLLSIFALRLSAPWWQESASFCSSLDFQCQHRVRPRGALNNYWINNCGNSYQLYTNVAISSWPLQFSLFLCWFVLFGHFCFAGFTRLHHRMEEGGMSWAGTGALQSSFTWSHLILTICEVTMIFLILQRWNWGWGLLYRIIEIVEPSLNPDLPFTVRVGAWDLAQSSGWEIIYCMILARLWASVSPSIEWRLEDNFNVHFFNLRYWYKVSMWWSTTILCGQAVSVLCQLLMQGKNGLRSATSLIPHAMVVSSYMDSEIGHVSFLAHATVANVMQAENEKRLCLRVCGLPSGCTWNLSATKEKPWQDFQMVRAGAPVFQPTSSHP